MKKITSLLLTAALLVTAAGCGNNEEVNETTTETQPQKVTDVAFEAPETPDTTVQSLEFLKTRIPLFTKYLERRMSYPLTYEVETRTAEGVSTAGLYIKDEDTIAFTSTDYTGASDNTIYDGTSLYYVIHNEKIAYVRDDMPVETAKDTVANSLLKIDIKDASANTYETGVKDYDGKTYNYEAMTDTFGNVSEYYFNQETDDLEIVVSGGVATYITLIDNKVDDSVFEIPDDYEKGDLDAYLDEMIKESRAEAAAEAEAQAE